MIVKTFHFEIAKQPTLGVMPVENFTEPVYQKIREISALNFNTNFLTRLDGSQVHNQMRQRPGGILKHLRQRGAEGFKSDVRCVLENTKTGHGTPGKRPIGTIARAAAGLGLSGNPSIGPRVYHNQDRGPWIVRRKLAGRPAALIHSADCGYNEGHHGRLQPAASVRQWYKHRQEWYYPTTI